MQAFQRRETSGERSEPRGEWGEGEKVQMHAAYQASEPKMSKKQTTEPSSMATETSNNSTENLKPEVTQRQKLSIIAEYIVAPINNSTKKQLSFSG